MTRWCSACGDRAVVTFPCKFEFHDGIILSFNICVECLNGGTLEINLSRKRLVAKIIKKLSNKK